ncbi:MAG: hypothetical protein ACKVPJ_00795 [Chitinophagales bacterium]
MKLRKILFIFFRILLFFIFLGTIPYYLTIIYNFPGPEKFSGNAWYNPYENHLPVTQKVNLHTHAKAYGGLTFGADSADSMVSAYTQKGYSLVSISDYHSIEPKQASQKNYLPAYEHGYNLFKIHFNVFGAENVNFFDYMIYLNTSQKQQMINMLAEDGNMISLNHPVMRNGYSPTEMRKLCNYTLMEVWNLFGTSEEYWDAALSSGHVVFLLANDDSHSLEKGSFRMWNKVLSSSANPDSICISLKQGKNYGVWNLWGIYGTIPELDFNIYMKTDTLSFFSSITFDSIHVIVDDGNILSKNKITNSVSSFIPQQYSYARLKLFAENYQVLFNPVIRYNGVNVQEEYEKTLSVNWFLSVLFKVGVLLFHLMLWFFWRKLRA